LGDKDEEMEEINKEADEVIKRIRGGAVKVWTKNIEYVKD
jgi:hypothetical protein